MNRGSNYIRGLFPEVALLSSLIISTERRLTMNIVPKAAWLTVNRACNFRCKWCYAKGTDFDDKQTLTMDLALRLLSIVRDLGIKNITLIGGEPTLWKHLMDFNIKCREIGMQTTLITNAYRFGDNDYWDKYIKYSNDKVGASLKAFDVDSATELAGIRDFEVLKIGLQRMTSCFKGGISFLCNSFVNNDLMSLARTAYECGARSILIGPCTPSFINGKVDATGMLPLKELVASVVSQYSEMNTLFVGKLTFAIKTPLCIWPISFIEKLIDRKQLRNTCQFQHRSGIIFDPKGQVLACNSMVDFPIGMIDKDYSDAESMIKLFNADTVVNDYNHINSYPSKRCVSCSHASICGGGCPLIWAVYNAKESIPGW